MMLNPDWSSTAERTIPNLGPATDTEPSTTIAGLDTKRRLGWLDALKVCSILGVIVIHVTADSSGRPYTLYPASDRIVPSLLRALGIFFNYPIFFVVSFFLLGGSPLRHEARYVEVIAERLRRLLPPFLIWSVIYLAFRNVKAVAFDYHSYYLQELATPISWLKYLLIGSAQYHLHFLPTLIALSLIYPLYKLASKWPFFGVAVIALLLVWPSLDAIVYARLADKTDVLPLALSATKLVGLAGYGFLGFALYSLNRRGISRSTSWGLAIGSAAIAVAAGLSLWREALATAEAGRWLPRDLGTHLAHYLAPVCVVIVFFLAKEFPWSAVWVRLSTLSFGVYLFHPIVLDSLEIAERGWDLQPGFVVVFNFIAVTTLSFLTVSLAARIPMLRPLFGLSSSEAR